MPMQLYCLQTLRYLLPITVYTNHHADLDEYLVKMYVFDNHTGQSNIQHFNR